MNKKMSIIIILCIVFVGVVIDSALFLYKNKKSNDQDTGNSNNNNNNNSIVEPKYDVNISISSDKTEYTSGEIITLKLTITNNMSISFPYENYSFGIWYVNKSEYDTASTVYPNFMPLAQSVIDLLTVKPGEKYTSNIFYNSTSIPSGEYYIQFFVQKADSYGGVYLIDTVKCAIIII